MNLRQLCNLHDAQTLRKGDCLGSNGIMLLLCNVVIFSTKTAIST